MCMLVFLASDYELPAIPWDPAQPGFHLTALTEQDEPVRGRFTKPWVCYVGSHEQCGCGFQYGEHEGIEEDDLPARQNSRRRLVEYLMIALQHQVEVELFACWDGDQATTPEYRDRVRAADLLRSRTLFREREFLSVHL